MSLSLSAFLIVRRVSPKRLGKRGMLASLFLCLSTSCFVFSLQFTDAANTLVIFATSPLLAAVASRYFLQEKLPLVTWMATVVALCGVGLSLLDGASRGILRGEVIALCGALCLASHFTALRWWRSADGPLSIWAAGWLVGVVALTQAKPFSPHSSDWLWIILLGSIVLPMAFASMSIGPRYLPAPEVGLLLLGETVLGPVWVWYFLGEEPGSATLFGGGIVIVTLFIHSLVIRQIRSRNQNRR